MFTKSYTNIHDREYLLKITKNFIDVGLIGGKGYTEMLWLLLCFSYFTKFKRWNQSLRWVPIFTTLQIWLKCVKHNIFLVIFRQTTMETLADTNQMQLWLFWHFYSGHQYVAPMVSAIQRFHCRFQYSASCYRHKEIMNLSNTFIWDHTLFISNTFTSTASLRFNRKLSTTIERAPGLVYS